MKKILFSVAVLNVLSLVVFSQNIISKVPANATAVIKYTGGSLFKKVPVSKFDSYTFIKKKVYKELGLDDKTSLEGIGLDVKQDAYQYGVSTDTSRFFVTLIAVKNAAKFGTFIKKQHKKGQSIESKNGFKFYSVSDKMFVGWNGSLATVVVSNYESSEYFYYNPQPVPVDSSKLYEGVGTIEPYADSTVALEPAYPETATASAVDTTMNVPGTMIVNAPVGIVPPVTTTDSTALAITALDSLVATAADSAVAVESPHVETKEEAAETKARDKFYKELEIKNKRTRKKLALNVLFTTYDSTITSIAQTSKSFTELVDLNADIAIWTKSGGFLNSLYPYPYSRYNYLTNYNMGFDQVANIYFETDKVRLEQKVYTEKESNRELFKSLYNNKQSQALINYIKPTDLGFLSMSVNTEAGINLYYEMLKNILASKSYFKEKALADAMIDIVEIVIDEKGIANALPGNAMVILHDLKPKQVEYISYDYDSSFNYKPVTKTKEEPSPNFTVVFETHNEKIFNKLIDLPVKLNTDTAYNYTKTGDYYTLVLGPKNNVDTMYFMVKDGKCIITTERQYVTQSAPVENAGLSAATKQSIQLNNYAARIDIKSLLESFSGQVTDKNNKKMMAYLKQNVGDMTSESSIKNGLITTNTILNIKGDHKNSFEYFFNVLDNVLQLMDAPTNER